MASYEDIKKATPVPTTPTEDKQKSNDAPGSLPTSMPFRGVALDIAGDTYQTTTGRARRFSSLVREDFKTQEKEFRRLGKDLRRINNPKTGPEFSSLLKGFREARLAQSQQRIVDYIIGGDLPLTEAQIRTLVENGRFVSSANGKTGGALVVETDAWGNIPELSRAGGLAARLLPAFRDGQLSPDSANHELLHHRQNVVEIALEKAMKSDSNLSNGLKITDIPTSIQTESVDVEWWPEAQRSVMREIGAYQYQVDVVPSYTNENLVETLEDVYVERHIESFQARFFSDGNESELFAQYKNENSELRSHIRELAKTTLQTVKKMRAAGVEIETLSDILSLSKGMEDFCARWGSVSVEEFKQLRGVRGLSAAAWKYLTDKGVKDLLSYLKAEGQSRRLLGTATRTMGFGAAFTGIRAFSHETLSPESEHLVFPSIPLTSINTSRLVGLSEKDTTYRTKDIGAVPTFLAETTKTTAEIGMFVAGESVVGYTGSVIASRAGFHRTAVFLGQHGIGRVAGPLFAIGVGWNFSSDVDFVHASESQINRRAAGAVAEGALLGGSLVSLVGAGAKAGAPAGPVGAVAGAVISAGAVLARSVYEIHKVERAGREKVRYLAIAATVQRALDGFIHGDSVADNKLDDAAKKYFNEVSDAYLANLIRSKGFNLRELGVSNPIERIVKGVNDDENGLPSRTLMQVRNENGGYVIDELRELRAQANNTKEAITSLYKRAYIVEYTDTPDVIRVEDELTQLDRDFKDTFPSNETQDSQAVRRFLQKRLPLLLLDISSTKDGEAYLFSCLLNQQSNRNILQSNAPNIFALDIVQQKISEIDKTTKQIPSEEG